MKYIPLGFQCTVSDILKSMNKRTSSLPFDWMLSRPEFVYNILELLFSDMSIDEIVREHFFNCKENANFYAIEYFKVGEGTSLYNRKYNVIFPHDTFDEENIQKYIRRLTHLKDIIINEDNITFIYISPSSNLKGNFFIDDVCQINEDDITLYFNKIVSIITRQRSNFKFLMFDTFPKSKIKLDDRIERYVIPAKEDFVKIQPDIIDILKNK